MTPTSVAPVTVEPAFLLMKRGLFYRPGNAGYTGIKADAGRYNQSEADELSGVTAIHENDAPMFAPACWEDVKVKHLLGIIAERDRSLAALASAPAGDGVEEDKIVSRAVEQVMRGFSFETLAGPENLRARLSLCARQAVHDTAAALARPRAAVGEREEWELPDLGDLHRDIERLCDHDLGNDRMSDLLRGAMDMLAAADLEYAALQSPPAKVEGV